MSRSQPQIRNEIARRRMDGAVNQLAFWIEDKRLVGWLWGWLNNDDQ